VDVQEFISCVNEGGEDYQVLSRTPIYKPGNAVDLFAVLGAWCLWRCVTAAIIKHFAVSLSF
jgi:hypothetical protein